jgi:nucleotide-binding universal stress UspA family protein
MELPKRILVAVDFTPTAERALDYAIDLAKSLGARVTVLHSYELPIVGFPDGAIVATADIAARIMNASQEAMEKLVTSRAGRGVPLEPVIKTGPPWEVINDYADDIKADLIVIGTHGRRGLSRALLGSVAENVIRTSTRPILVLHGPRTS